MRELAPGNVPADPMAECPCAGCRFARQCADKRMACARYAMYAAGERAERWQVAPCAPSKAIMAAIEARRGPPEQRQAPAPLRRRPARVALVVPG